MLLKMFTTSAKGRLMKVVIALNQSFRQWPNAVGLEGCNEPQAILANRRPRLSRHHS